MESYIKNLERYDTRALYNDFIKAEPFNHIVIDNFMEVDTLNNVLNEIKSYSHDVWYDKSNAVINNEQDSIVQSKKIAVTDYNKMGPLLQQFMDFSKSKEMISFLESVTGISGLHDDPYMLGAGIHRTGTNGRLAIHADFNIHPNTNKYRRLNILLYLNENWQPEFNGQLELWEKDMSKCVHSIPPIFNRLVLFRITDDAFHGHPELWLSESPRLSLALYYYTDDRPEEEKAPFHWAAWQYRDSINRTF
jgi:Rps23 Pro-64 3,4-dihydroxylase Tpa1-like proline 4-hydroxylase